MHREAPQPSDDHVSHSSHFYDVDRNLSPEALRAQLECAHSKRNIKGNKCTRCGKVFMAKHVSIQVVCRD